MNEYKVENAKITSTRLGVQHTDHGVLSFMIFLSFGGTGQGFGGYVLDDYSSKADGRVPTILGSSLLLAVHRVFGVDWEDLKSTVCRGYHHHSNVFAIGHLLEDKWLYYSEKDRQFAVKTFSAMIKEAN